MMGCLERKGLERFSKSDPLGEYLIHIDFWGSEIGGLLEAEVK